MKVNIGTRNSQLALIQANHVMTKLKLLYPDIEFNLVPMTTTGDQVLNKPLKDIRINSLFTRELEFALLEKRVDIIVHSLKDLPTAQPEGCCIGAVLARDSREDTIVLSAKHRASKTKPVELLLGLDEHAGKKLIIGTSSPRRVAMLKRCNPNVTCTDIRGNLNTRFNKLDKEDGEYDAIVLAKAGLDRMDWSERSSCLLGPADGMQHWSYAVGQGAIAVECRAGEDAILDLLGPLTDLKTTYEVVAERAMMKKLEAGCSAPLGVRASWSKDERGNEMLNLKGYVFSLDGEKLVDAMDFIMLGTATPGRKIGPDTTDVVLSEKVLSNNGAMAGLLAAGELGYRVASKLIDLGCIEVMESARA